MRIVGSFYMRLWALGIKVKDILKCSSEGASLMRNGLGLMPPFGEAYHLNELNE